MEDVKTENIDRLFVMIGELGVTINQLSGAVSKVCANVEDIYRRMNRLEDRDEKFLERIERISVLLARVEDSSKQSSTALSDLAERVKTLEHDNLTLKNNWKWLAGITATLGGVFSFVVNMVMRVLG